MRQLATVFVQLGLATLAHHEPADRIWLELVEGSRVPSQLDYMRALVRVFGFDASLEAALAYTPSLAGVVDMRDRQRSGWIAHDLLHLGLTPAQIATIGSLDIAPFGNLDEALGWLYVHERATLVHEHVYRVLLERLPELEPAMRYLGLYVGRLGLRIEELGKLLEPCAEPARFARISAAAATALQSFDAWVSSAEVRRSSTA